MTLMAAKLIVSDELARIVGSPAGRNEPPESHHGREKQLDGLAKIDEALKQMGIPLVEPFQRPLSTRIKPPT